jgi:acetyl/propionyl-CoA carboxylase alpha subunit
MGDQVFRFLLAEATVANAFLLKVRGKLFEQVFRHPEHALREPPYLTAPCDGRVSDVLVKPSTRVEAGDLLLMLG